MLARNHVEFIVIGGVAAVLSGAPISTFDLDIVPERSPANLDRLLSALRELDARYRDPGGRILRPEAQALAGVGHHLLMTRAGPLDVLGQVVGGRGYQELSPTSHDVSLGDTTVRVLDLAMLIQLKEELGRDKDRAVLPLLRRTLEESG